MTLEMSEANSAGDAKYQGEDVLYDQSSLRLIGVMLRSFIMVILAITAGLPACCLGFK